MQILKSTLKTFKAHFMDESDFMQNELSKRLLITQ